MACGARLNAHGGDIKQGDNITLNAHGGDIKQGDNVTFNAHGGDIKQGDNVTHYERGTSKSYTLRPRTSRLSS